LNLVELRLVVARIACTILVNLLFAAAV